MRNLELLYDVYNVKSEHCLWVGWPFLPNKDNCESQCLYPRPQRPCTQWNTFTFFNQTISVECLHGWYPKLLVAGTVRFLLLPSLVSSACACWAPARTRESLLCSFDSVDNIRWAAGLYRRPSFQFSHNWFVLFSNATWFQLLRTRFTLRNY